jgi:ABC-type nitrate/sulfonate/bicarbonate transport system substrate-binding protein
MRLAIPDLISNSYFPALAAAELGFFAAEGLDVTAELIFPVDRCYQALRDGEVDFAARDLPYYDAAITPVQLAAVNRFAEAMSLVDGEPSYTDIVWQGDS